MATRIDSHSRDLKLGNALIRLRLKAAVALIELPDMTFEFCVDYSYTGTFGDRGRICVPVDGDCDEKRELGKGLTIGYTVSDWALTDRSLSCDLTVWANYKRLDMNSKPIFQSQHFSGPRPVLSPSTI
ncbi:MAG: hypothetical protein ETSY1_10285 [Candidatus Entotheonella factor]|uniref:Uncharacterized protein n=1 Tax=Entotheonella factor TaxID=1429438 RepID=W4LTC1_ENTF1|nr:MAG: hypothetical protein ETSY1_10285 [Candidatus Entotheonella factor]